MTTHDQHSIDRRFLFRSGRGGRIEQWRDNEDGTITRLTDGLTLTAAYYALQGASPRLSRQFMHFAA